MTVICRGGGVMANVAKADEGGAQFCQFTRTSYGQAQSSSSTPHMRSEKLAKT